MRSIRTKLFLFLMIVMVAYAGVGILLNLFFLKPYYVQQSEASFARAAAQIKALNTPQSISNHITEMGHNSGLFLAVTDPQFQILCSSNNLEGQTLPPDAIQHCTGEIIMRFEQQAGYSCISVFNTGKPIAQEALEHIFEPFYRLDYARKEEAHFGQEKGHGLGLAIVRSIAEVHGGKAFAKNRENGVEFFLEIPTA